MTFQVGIALRLLGGSKGGGAVVSILMYVGDTLEFSVSSYPQSVTVQSGDPRGHAAATGGSGKQRRAATSNGEQWRQVRRQ